MGYWAKNFGDDLFQSLLGTNERSYHNTYILTEKV